MFILIGYVSLALVQLYRRYQRRRFYSGIMMRALRNGSVLVQRGNAVQQSIGRGLLSSSLLSSPRPYKEVQLLQDDHLNVSLVNPKQQVDMGGWTSYLDLHPAQDFGSSVVALLEAGHLDKSNCSISADRTVSPECQVHVLKHGCPLAWKSGSPFGIILHCSCSDFVLLCDAFEQGCLVLDDDLHLYRMLTVSTVGKPKSMKRPRSEETVAVSNKGNEVKARRSNTDPPHLASSIDTESPLCVSVENSEHNLMTEVVQKVSTEYETILPVEPEKKDIVSQNGKEFGTEILLTKGYKGQFKCGQVCEEKSGFMNGAVHKPQDMDSAQVFVNKNVSKETEVNVSLDQSPVITKTTVSSQEFEHTENHSNDINISPLSPGTQKHTYTVNGSQNKISKVPNGSHQEQPVPGNDFGSLNGSSQGKKASVQNQAGKNPSMVTDSSSANSNGVKGSHTQACPTEPDHGNADITSGSFPGNLGKRISKPPNVVVYCGKKDSTRKFGNIKAGLEQCLNFDAYTVYNLPHDDFMAIPWEDNAAALVISHDYLHDKIGKKCADFLTKGGKVISFNSSMEAEFLVRKEMKGRPGVTKFSLDKWREVSAIKGRYHYVPGSLKKANSSMDTLVVDSKSGEPLVVQLILSSENGNGKAIFSQLLLERDSSEVAVDGKTFTQLKQNHKERLEVLRHLLSMLDLDTTLRASQPLTPCYMLAKDQFLKKSFLDSIAGRIKQGCIRSRYLSLKFVTSKSGPAELTATKDILPVITDISAESFKGVGDAPHFQYFDPEVYWNHLTSSVLGRVVLYTEIIPTTMIVFEGVQFSIPENVGMMAVAGRQTSGKGRGGNLWLSPVGCAMFTLPLSFPADSYLGQRASFLQHLVSLSVVHSIRSLPGYQELDLRLKWPNDIYFGNNAKLGGVVINSTIMGSTLFATVGCGVNVSNSQPTMCINTIIEQHNKDRGSNLKLLSSSQVLARTVSVLETLLSQFQDKGHEDFCQLYYKYWLHSGARVKVEREDNMDVEICGLDDFGFLRVINKQGQQLSVQPDGNSFDMLRNLITIKRD